MDRGNLRKIIMPLLREYWITLNFQVEARDIEEAAEIANDLLGAAKKNVPWKLIGGEVTEIEDVG